MNVYYEMLKDLGISISEDISSLEAESKYESVDNTKEYMSDSDEQVQHEYNEFEWGYDASGNKLYGPSDSVTCFALNRGDDKNCKKIHRYIRKLRFKPIFLQIVGLSNKKISEKVIQTVKKNLKKLGKIDKNLLWKEIRNILKQNKIKKHYNDIPTIIRIILNLRVNNNMGLNVIRALEHFDKLSHAFDWNRHVIKRSYFLNMRFVALKLADKFRISFPYHTPLTRTPKKEKYLEELYRTLESLVEEQANPGRSSTPQKNE